MRTMHAPVNTYLVGCVQFLTVCDCCEPMNQWTVELRFRWCAFSFSVAYTCAFTVNCLLRFALSDICPYLLCHRTRTHEVQTTLHNRLFSEPLTVYGGKHVVPPHFRRNYLKANKSRKSELTRKVEHPYHFFSRVSTLTRDIDMANLSVCPSVRPSVRPSVTFRHQMKTA